MISLLRSIVASIHIVIVWAFKCSILTIRTRSVIEDKKRPLNIIVAIRTLSPFNLFFELSYCLGAIRKGQAVLLVSDRLSRFHSHEFYTNSSSWLYRF